MPDYRRLFIPGGCWFFTATLSDRRSRLLVERIDVLRMAVAAVKRAHPFGIDAMVVLPDHIHAVWTLPEGDADFPLRWRLIKRAFSVALPEEAGLATARRREGERGIWQRRYWEHLIRDDDDFGRHVDYCHINPMRHGLVSRVRDWPYSSFHRAVAAGTYAEDWGGEVA